MSLALSAVCRAWEEKKKKKKTALAVAIDRQKYIYIFYDDIFYSDRAFLEAALVVSK